MARPPLCIRVPGDKSVSHRALLFNAMADGEARIIGLLRAEDVGRTEAAVRQLGASLTWEGEVLRLRGAPWHHAGEIDCGNSGTTARLLMGALAPRAGARLMGDASLSRRPMRRVLDLLARMGARTSAGGTLPVEIFATPLHGIEHLATVASAQVKSAVLLAGLGAEGETAYTEPLSTRDHTERMLAAMGAPLTVSATAEGTRLAVRRGALSARDVRVPGDVSSATFWMVAAALVEGAVVELPGVGLNPTRTAALDVLRRMGAEIEVEEEAGIEPIGLVRVRGRGLRGTTIAGAEVPHLIDELPVLAVAAAFAEGITTVRDAAELRVKESDRIEAIVGGLRAIGVEAESRPDGFVVQGGGARGGEVLTHGDHRIAMAFSVAGLRVPVGIDECASVQTSYPGFFAELERVRGEISVSG